MIKNKIKKIDFFRNKINSNKLSIGSWLHIDNTDTAEIMSSNKKFEWLVVDREHGQFNLSSLKDICRSIEINDTLPLVRISSNQKHEIQTVLEAGFCGIIFPNITSVKQIKELISYSKWPPYGNRGVGYSRANSHGEKLDLYKKFSKKIICIAMIENIQAVNNLEDILSASQLDGIFIGPYDLSASVCRPGDFKNLKFIKAMKQIKKVSKKYKKPMGIHVVMPSKKNVNSYYKEGFTYIAHSLDTVYLRTSVSNNND